MLPVVGAPRSFAIDGDHDVDLADYYWLALCMTYSGPASPLNPGHTCLADHHTDVDGDHDVDLGDFALFQAHFGEPG